MKINETNEQSLITVVTTNYMDLLVPQLLEKSFDAYSKKDFSKRHFQVSVHENTHATAGVVLSVLALEAYRNRIYYLNKAKLGSKGLAVDLCDVFCSEDKDFPAKAFNEILTELIIVRDAIVHNHIYEVKIVNDGDWNMISINKKLV